LEIPVSTNDVPVDILIVDDTLANIQVLSGMLKQQGYKVRPVLDGKAALKAAETHAPDLILLDITMPEMNGYEVCEKLKQNADLKQIPVIFISALTEPLDKVKAFTVGGVDYITKPFQLEEVRVRVENHLHLASLQKQIENYNRYLEEKVIEQVSEISDSQMATILALAKLAEYRDEDTGRHIERIQYFCRLLVGQLAGKPAFKDVITPIYIENITHASPLHDIGKVGISDTILLKPGKLTPAEFEVMKTHTVIGFDLLQVIKDRYTKNSFINVGIEISRSHHEKWDGSGYPDGLKGDAIPLSARILAVADVYDALRSKRPYKTGFDHSTSCKIILDGKGIHFDPDVIEVFVELADEFERVYAELV
jgi:putative two-component system response regulator